MRKRSLKKSVLVMILAVAVVLTGFSLPQSSFAADSSPVYEHIYQISLPEYREGYEIVALDLTEGSSKVIAEDVTEARALRNDDYCFEIRLKAGYTQKSKPAVYVNCNQITPDENGIYKISDVAENETLSVAGICLVGARRRYFGRNR